MTTYRLMSSSTLPPKFAIACAVAMGFAVVSLFSGTDRVALPQAAPDRNEVVVLPTILVVPTAADRAAAAALDVAATAVIGRIDGV